MDRCDKQTILYTNKSGECIPVHGNLSRPRIEQPYNYPKNDRSRKYNNYNKYLLPVILCLTSIANALPASAEVGGVSATAAPVANSSGSVTNQAIQVLQGPYITNTYGNGIQCQGPTRNFTPYVTGSVSAAKPYEPYYMAPVYDVTDNFGAFDDDGNPMGDGILDHPGDILFRKKTRTGQKDNYSLGVGFSITWSEPLDKDLQNLCKDAATTQIKMQQQLTANKRLDFELARLKNCGDLMLKGITFHPKSPMHKICADVIVNNPPGHNHPHRHSIPTVTSNRAEDLGVPLRKESSVSSQ